MFLWYILIILFSVVIHEVSHGVMANSLGDPTAKNLGRITLNPIKHLDLFGSILLPFFLFVVGSPFVFAYAKPVPYNPANLRDRKFGPAKVALAGPAVNLVLAVLFGLVSRFLPHSLGSTLLPDLLKPIIQFNLILAIFNLVPIPPLDGHWLLFTFLPAKFTAFKLFLMHYSLIIFIAFLIFIFPFVYPLINFLFRVIVGRSA